MDQGPSSSKGKRSSSPGYEPLPPIATTTLDPPGSNIAPENSTLLSEYYSTHYDLSQAGESSSKRERRQKKVSSNASLLGDDSSSANHFPKRTSSMYDSSTSSSRYPQAQRYSQAPAPYAPPHQRYATPHDAIDIDPSVAPSPPPASPQMQQVYANPYGYPEVAGGDVTYYELPSHVPPPPQETLEPNPYGYGQYPFSNPYSYQPNVGYEYPPAQQMMRRRAAGTIFRHKTTKVVELTASGNFVVEIPVPEKVIAMGKYRTGREFTHLRYTAACGDPNEFAERGYTLRAAELGRQTEMFIVMTMYNEDEYLFTKTFKAVMKNIAHMCSKKRNTMWGPDGWQKVVVCVVSDGRTKINPRTLNVLGVMGVYQDGILKTSISDEEVSAHIFEYTTQLCVDSDLNCRGANTGLVPVQVLFCLKEKNKKKLNSHRWFFNAFGNILKPNVCILLDVGTKPTEQSLYRLWKVFDHDPQVAGACGEICVEKGSGAHKLISPLVAAQNFEYKMSNILDKPLESVFGFIAVLPGAFSAYRYKALQNGPDGTGPLEKYFLGERMHDSHGDVKLSQANMYLAEDRILCFELVTKRGENWVLRYCKDASAETDVPDTIAEFISQRRRWLNGSFFAGVHAIIHWYQIFRSGHSPLRKLAVVSQLIYNSINVVFSWFSLANFYLIFYFLTSGMVAKRETDPFYGAGETIFLVFRQVYIFALVMIFVASLGMNRPQANWYLYMACFVLFSVLMGLMLYMAGFSIYLSVSGALDKLRTPDADGDTASVPDLLSEPAFRDLVMSTVATYGSYFISSFAYLDPWHMFSSFFQYLMLLPSFVNILMVYAFTNLHDVSWGTKGENAPVDLAPVHVVKEESGKKTTTTDLPVNQADIDAAYENFLMGLKPKEAEKEKKVDGRSDKLRQEDYFKTFRTNVVLLWILCNTALVAVLTTEAVAEKLGVFVGAETALRGNTYLTFILWSVSALSLFRFVGSMVYLCVQGGNVHNKDERDKRRSLNVDVEHGRK